MKYLKLETVQIQSPICPCCGQVTDLIAGIRDKTFQFDYREMLLKHLRENPQGANLEFMETALIVIGKVRVAEPGSWLALEDAEMMHVQKVMSDIRYFLNDEALVAFLRALRNPVPELPVTVKATHA